jgi:hypothetical protein
MLTVCEMLPAPWAELCRSKGSARFAWAHDGVKAGGNWVELCPGGELQTKWGVGSWEWSSCDPHVLDLAFGAVRHVCRLKIDEGKFQVEERFLRRSGQAASNPKVKGVEVVSAGWLSDTVGQCPAQQRIRTSTKPETSAKAVQSKMRAAEVAEEELKAAERTAVEAADAATAAAKAAVETAELAKKAEAARCQAASLAQRKRKEAEGAAAEMEKTGLSRFGFSTPKTKRTREQDISEENGSDEKRLRDTKTTDLESEEMPKSSSADTGSEWEPA